MNRSSHSKNGKNSQTISFVDTLAYGNKYLPSNNDRFKRFTGTEDIIPDFEEIDKRIFAGLDADIDDIPFKSSDNMEFNDGNGKRFSHIEDLMPDFDEIDNMLFEGSNGAKFEHFEKLSRECNKPILFDEFQEYLYTYPESFAVFSFDDSINMLNVFYGTLSADGYDMNHTSLSIQSAAQNSNIEFYSFYSSSHNEEYEDNMPIEDILDMLPENFLTYDPVTSYVIYSNRNCDENLSNYARDKIISDFNELISQFSVKDVSGNLATYYLETLVDIFNDYNLNNNSISLGNNLRDSISLVSNIIYNMQ